MSTDPRTRVSEPMKWAAVLFAGLWVLGLAALLGNRGLWPRPPAARPADGSAVKTFTNSRAGLSGKLADYYVDFSFDYPAHWELMPPGAPGNTRANYVKVDHSADGWTHENFAVGSLRLSPVTRETLSETANLLSGEFAGWFPNYEMVSEGPVRFAGRDGYEFRFRFRVTIPDGRSADVWGRTIFLPDLSAEGNGLVLTMMATSHAAGIGGEDGLGVAGELPTILSSFRVGK